MVLEARSATRDALHVQALLAKLCCPYAIFMLPSPGLCNRRTDSDGGTPLATSAAFAVG